MDENKRLGERIKKIRKEQGMSQLEFSKAIGATKSAVSNWENGYNAPNNERLKIIADIGGVSVESLLYGDSMVADVYDDCLTNIEKFINSEGEQNSSPDFNIDVLLEVDDLIENADLAKTKNFLEEIKEDFIPILQSRIEEYGETRFGKEFYIRDRILSVGKAYTYKLELNKFDELFNQEGDFPSIKEDLIYFSNNIPYLKGKSYTYINTSERYKKLVHAKIDEILSEGITNVSDDVAQKAKSFTISTFQDIVKTLKEIDDLDHSDVVFTVFLANVDYLINETSLKIDDGNSFIKYLEFANRYFSDLLDDDDIINEIGSRKQFSSDLNSKTAAEMFKSGIKKNILDNNKLIEQIQNNLNK